MWACAFSSGPLLFFCNVLGRHGGAKHGGTKKCSGLVLGEGKSGRAKRGWAEKPKNGGFLDFRSQKGPKSDLIYLSMGGGYEHGGVRNVHLRPPKAAGKKQQCRCRSPTDA